MFSTSEDQLHVLSIRGLVLPFCPCSLALQLNFLFSHTLMSFLYLTLLIPKRCFTYCFTYCLITLIYFSKNYESMQPFRNIIWKYLSKALNSLFFLIQKFYSNTFSSKERNRSVHKTSYRIVMESCI